MTAGVKVIISHWMRFSGEIEFQFHLGWVLRNGWKSPRMKNFTLDEKNKKSKFSKFTLDEKFHLGWDSKTLKNTKYWPPAVQLRKIYKKHLILGTCGAITLVLIQNLHFLVTNMNFWKENPSQRWGNRNYDSISGKSEDNQGKYRVWKLQIIEMSSDWN